MKVHRSQQPTVLLTNVTKTVAATQVVGSLTDYVKTLVRGTWNCIYLYFEKRAVETKTLLILIKIKRLYHNYSFITTIVIGLQS